MLNDQDLCKQALDEFRIARDQLIQSYDSRPLSPEEAKQPRAPRDQFIRFTHQLAITEEDRQGFLSIDGKDLMKIKEVITKLPPMWHNGIDYAPLFTVIDKWIKFIEEVDKKDDKIATCFLGAFVVLIALDFILMYKYPLQVNIANGVLFFFFIFMVVGAFSDKYKTRR